LKNKEKKMTRFFHADTQKYAKRRKYILWLTLLPLFQVPLIAVLIMLVNFRAFHEKNYQLLTLYGAGAAALAGTLLFFAVYIITEKLIKRNARYTYFEIGEKSLILSRYDGDYIVRGKKLVSRRLFVIPLSSLHKIGFSEKKGSIYLEGGDFREYCDSSERLGYKLSDGFPEFESWWYNQNGFKNLPVVRIPKIFTKTDTDKIRQSIIEAKRNFNSAPKPKPYTHKESEFVRRRRAFDRFKRLQNL
jgi:hypothetical protein